MSAKTYVAELPGTGKVTITIKDINLEQIGERGVRYRARGEGIEVGGATEREAYAAFIDARTILPAVIGW